jgi:hypothetical protein
MREIKLRQSTATTAAIPPHKNARRAKTFAVGLNSFLHGPGTRQWQRPKEFRGPREGRETCHYRAQLKIAFGWFFAYSIRLDGKHRRPSLSDFGGG